MAEYKNIRLDIETYNELNSLAEKQGVPLGKTIAFLLGGIGKVGEPQKLEKAVDFDYELMAEKLMERLRGNNVQGGSALAERGSRTKGEVLSDIKGAEAERDDELNNCQDAETTRKLEKKWKAELDTLWAEYNALTGPKV